jgi:hypothetical protein
MNDDKWLKAAKDAFSGSTTYVDANYRKKWEDALSMFQSKHPAGSKYLTDTYKHRSKLFRPKTRSVVRRHEAALPIWKREERSCRRCRVLLEY